MGYSSGPPSMIPPPRVYPDRLSLGRFPTKASADLQINLVDSVDIRGKKCLADILPSSTVTCPFAILGPQDPKDVNTHSRTHTYAEATAFSFSILGNTCRRSVFGIECTFGLSVCQCIYAYDWEAEEVLDMYVKYVNVYVDKCVHVYICVLEENSFIKYQ